MSTINENMEKKIDLTQNDDYVMLGFFLVDGGSHISNEIRTKRKKIGKWNTYILYFRCKVVVVVVELDKNWQIVTRFNCDELLMDTMVVFVVVVGDVAGIHNSMGTSAKRIHTHTYIYKM